MKKRTTVTTYEHIPTGTQYRLYSDNAVGIKYPDGYWQDCASYGEAGNHAPRLFDYTHRGKEWRRVIEPQPMGLFHRLVYRVITGTWPESGPGTVVRHVMDRGPVRVDNGRYGKYLDRLARGEISKL
jgi:hypothetical protein